jgi:hypothetical protein
MGRNFYIGIHESKNGPRFRIMHRNGNVICPCNDPYSSRKERDDTVISLSLEHHFAIIDMDSGRGCMIAEGKIVNIPE